MSEAPNKSVLIVDDHEVNRRIAGLFLQPLGWTAVMAIDGAQALDIAARQHFDLILMDMVMPGMNGVQTTAALRDPDSLNCDTPVIAVTGTEFNRAEWALVGVTQFVMKPVDPDDLIEAVEEATRPGRRRINV